MSFRSSNDTPTIMTRLVSGKPARCLRTPFIQALIEDCDNLKLDDQPPYGYAYYGYKTMAGLLKDPRYGFYLAGQNYHQISPDFNTEQVFLKLVDELRSKLDLTLKLYSSLDSYMKLCLLLARIIHTNGAYFLVFT